MWLLVCACLGGSVWFCVFKFICVYGLPCVLDWVCLRVRCKRPLELLVSVYRGGLTLRTHYLEALGLEALVYLSVC